MGRFERKEKERKKIEAFVMFERCPSDRHSSSFSIDNVYIGFREKKSDIQIT